MYAPTSTNSPRSGPTSGEDDALKDFDGAGEILRAWGNGLRPDPDLTVSQWADRHRMLSGRATAEPGRYRTVRTPYMGEIMDRLSPGDPTQRIVFMKAAQVGTPRLAAISAPTTLAIALADSTNRCLVGLARDGLCTVYAHPERLEQPR